MMVAWSRRIEETLSIRLDEQSRNWFDFASTSFDWCGEFDEPIKLDASFGSLVKALWPGLMMPDLVPVIGNRYGDWYCLRVDADNSIRDIVHWYHGGGDIISVGKSLAEALLYDHCKSTIPGRTTWADDKPAIAESRQGMAWIAEQLACDSSELDSITQAFRSGEVRQGLLMLKQRGWSISAVHRDLVSLALESPFASFSDRSLAEHLQVSWERDMQRWFFDTRTIPESKLATIQAWFLSNSSRLKPIDSQLLRYPQAVFDASVLRNSGAWFAQDWQGVESYCREMMDLETDVAWPYHLAGWAACKIRMKRERATVGGVAWLIPFLGISRWRYVHTGLSKRS